MGKEMSLVPTKGLGTEGESVWGDAQQGTRINKTHEK